MGPLALWFPDGFSQKEIAPEGGGGMQTWWGQHTPYLIPWFGWGLPQSHCFCLVPSQTITLNRFQLAPHHVIFFELFPYLKFFSLKYP